MITHEEIKMMIESAITEERKRISRIIREAIDSNERYGDVGSAAFDILEEMSSRIGK